jgi:hypothetical protein
LLFILAQELMVLFLSQQNNPEGNKPKAASGAKLEGALSAESEAEKSWSSGGAKLRRNEVECPICVVPYEQGYKPVMTQCCFQVMCSECLCRLTDSRGQLACPFCRRGNEAQDDQAGLPRWERTGACFLCCDILLPLKCECDLIHLFAGGRRVRP